LSGLPPVAIAGLVLCLVVFSVLVGTGHRRVANAVGIVLLVGAVAALAYVRRRP
jgi:hypothetical protein